MFLRWPNRVLRLEPLHCHPVGRSLTEKEIGDNGGACPNPLHASDHLPVYAEMQYVLEHAGVSFAVVEDQEQVDKLLSIQDRLSSLRLSALLVPYPTPLGSREERRPFQRNLATDRGRPKLLEMGPKII